MLGHHDEGGTLQYAGNVGSGFSEETLAKLTQVLKKLYQLTSPFANNPSIAGKPLWVKPTLLANVSFAEWTQTGRIRHGVFNGLANDKKPQTMKPDTLTKNWLLSALLQINRPMPFQPLCQHCSASRIQTGSSTCKVA